MRFSSAFIVSLALAGAILAVGCAKEDPGPAAPPATSEKPADDKAAAGAASNGAPDLTIDEGKSTTSTAPEKEAASAKPEETKPEKPADDSSPGIPQLKDRDGKTLTPRERK